MIDPNVSVAFSVASKKGGYALLLGSGVSRSAGIPTGWEVVQDLIARVAQVTEKDSGTNPVEWYREEYGKEPDYSDLLETLAKSPEDRNAILRKYFEPTDDERTRGIKMPMPAHKAVAELVSAGYVRVIVTTNFDRLLEHALQERGIAPTVISTADQAQGALPFVHTNCTIIKVNGDYLDTRIKNTSAELGSYDERINMLLDRVFDEYGLIVCGWSATWDTALCAALERCHSHRFTTFWCKRGNLEDVASRVANFRLAEPIEIKDADSFFQDLAAKVAAIEQFDRPHPLSAKLGSVMVKRYLVDERYNIVLHDLVSDETERACAQWTEAKFPSMAPLTNEEFIKRIHRYEALVEVLVAIYATGCFWGENNQKHLWPKSLERVASAMGPRTGISLWVDLRLYPALLLLYAGGLGAIANGKHTTLATLLVKPRYDGPEAKSPLIYKLNWFAVTESNPEAANVLLAGDGRKYRFPMNEYLHRCLRPALREFVPSESDYDEVFDRFEYMFAMVWVDENPKGASGGWVPLGRFVRKHGVLASMLSLGEPIDKIIDAEVEREGENWPPLRAGLFGGSMERFRSAKQKVDGFIGFTRQSL